jgi:hypothetical protein
MAKKKGTAEMVLIILALVFPLGGANFILNVVLTIMYLPSLSAYLTTEIDTALRIFLPFVLYLVSLGFSIALLKGKTKEKALTLLALVLNSILIASGVFFLITTYFL